MAEDKTEREIVTDTILTKLKNLVKSSWFTRLCYAISGKEEDEFSSEITTLLDQVKRDKTTYLQANKIEIDAIKIRRNLPYTEAAKQTAVMTKVNEYLNNECSWATVQETIVANKGYNRTKPCRTEEIVLDVAKIDVSSTALAINNKLIEQIKAYLDKYPGIENPKTNVMTAIKKYLEGTDSEIKQWSDVQTVINRNPGHSDKRWGFYSQVGSTIKQVKDYKVKLGEIREDIPLPEAFDDVAQDDTTFVEQVDKYISNNKKTYQELDIKYLPTLRDGTKLLYASLDPSAKFNMISGIPKESKQQTYHKREIVTAVKHYLEGNLSWLGVCELMKKYPLWDIASHKSSLNTIINDIKANRPNETACAAEIFTLMNSIKSKMLAITTDVNAPQTTRDKAKDMIEIINSKLWYASAYPKPKGGFGDNAKLLKQYALSIDDRVSQLVKHRPELNADSIIKTLDAFDDMAANPLARSRNHGISI